MLVTGTREAVAADRDYVVALWHAAGVSRPWNDPALDFDRAVTGPSSAVLVHHVDGRLVASAMVGVDGHRGWAYYVSVAPDRQGQGLGRTIMAAVEDWARERGVPKLEIMVRRDNAATQGFYAALGYADQDVEVLGRWL